MRIVIKENGGRGTAIASHGCIHMMLPHTLLADRLCACEAAILFSADMAFRTYAMMCKVTLQKYVTYPKENKNVDATNGCGSKLMDLDLRIDVTFQFLQVVQQNECKY